MSAFCITFHVDQSGPFDRELVERKLLSVGGRKVSNTVWFFPPSHRPSPSGTELSGHLCVRDLVEVQDWIASWEDLLQGDLFYMVMQCVSIAGQVSIQKDDADVINSWFHSGA